MTPAAGRTKDDKERGAEGRGQDPDKTTGQERAAEVRQNEKDDEEATEEVELTEDEQVEADRVEHYQSVQDEITAAEEEAAGTAPGEVPSADQRLQARIMQAPDPGQEPGAHIPVG